MKKDIFNRTPKVAVPALRLHRLALLVLPVGFALAVLARELAYVICPGSLILLIILMVISNAMQVRVVRRTLAMDRLACMGCGYDLRASLQSGQCPECGLSFDPETLKDEWDAWLVPARYDTAPKLPYPRYAIKLRRWYWIGFAGLPIGYVVYTLGGGPGWVVGLILIAPLVAAVVSGLKFGEMMEKVEATKFKVCTECGYDLQAHPPAGKCPECGVEYTIDRNIMLWKNWCMVRDKPRKR